MATRSIISIENIDKSIESIYCHWDGYPDGVGATLKNHYKSEKKVRELISLGDISSLREQVKIPEGKQHSFENPLKNVTIAYHRDRGENNCNAYKYVTMRGFKNSWNKRYSMCEYAYVYSVKTKEWTTYSI